MGFSSGGIRLSDNSIRWIDRHVSMQWCVVGTLGLAASFAFAMLAVASPHNAVLTGLFASTQACVALWAAINARRRCVIDRAGMRRPGRRRIPWYEMHYVERPEPGRPGITFAMREGHEPLLLTDLPATYITDVTRLSGLPVRPALPRARVRTSFSAAAVTRSSGLDRSAPRRHTCPTPARRPAHAAHAGHARTRAH